MARDSAFEAWVQILPDFSDFNTRATSGITSAMGRAGDSGGTAFGNSFKSNVGGFFAGGAIAGIAAAGANAIGHAIGEGIRGGIEYGLNSIALASDLNESLNANRVQFGEDIAAQLEKLGSDAPKRLALTRQAFAAFSTQFSSFARTIRGNDVVGFLDELTTRAADFASVYNIEVADALQLFQSGLAGETEPLRRFGKDLSAASVEAFAYANGIAEVGTELNEAQKQQARYGLLLEQTSDVIGDNANTADEYAGQLRRLNVALEEAQTDFGAALLPTAVDVVTFANDELLPILSSALDKVGPVLSSSLEDALPEIKRIIESAAEGLPDAIDGAFAAIESFSFLVDENSGPATALNETSDALDEAGLAVYEWRQQWTAGYLEITEAGLVWVSAQQHAINEVERANREKSDQIKDYWKSSLDQMKKDAEAASLASAGVAFAQGFADGIETGSEAAIRAAERMALAARDKVKTAMQIQSPSRVMREYGGYVSEGFALGITDNLGMVDAAFGSLVPSGVRAGTSIDIGRAANLPPVYVQNPFTGEYLLAAVDDRAGAQIARYDKASEQGVQQGFGGLV